MLAIQSVYTVRFWRRYARRRPAVSTYCMAKGQTVSTVAPVKLEQNYAAVSFTMALTAAVNCA